MTSVNRKALGVALREERKKLKKSMEDLADEFISAGTIGNIERGFTNVSEEKCIYYAQKLGLGNRLFGIASESELKEEKIRKELNYVEEIAAGNPDVALKKLQLLHKNFLIDSYANLSPIYHFLKGRCYFEKKLWGKASECYQNALKRMEQAPELEKSNIVASSFNDLGRIVYYDLNDLELALSYTQQGLEAVHNQERQYTKYFLLLNKVVYLEQLNRLEEAKQTLDVLHSELDHFKTNFRIVIQMYERYATVLNALQLPMSALEFAEKGNVIAWENKLYDRLFTLWTTLGIVYLSIEDLEKAEEYCSKAIDVQSNTKRDYILITTYTVLGSVYIKTKQYSNALIALEKAVSMGEKSKDTFRYVEALRTLGNYYLSQQAYEQAIDPYIKVEQLSHQHNLIHHEYYSVLNLCTCYKQTGDKENFQKYNEKLYSILNSKEGEANNHESNSIWGANNR